MGNPLISVIIPTRDRSGALRETLAALGGQTLSVSDYEVIVVDDGSRPAVQVPWIHEGPRCAVLRLNGRERSAARNAGARVARGDLVVFVDDDITVSGNFLEAHVTGHREWPGALVVGSIQLSDEVLRGPFGRFRQALEQRGIPAQRGIAGASNLCTAQNMSVDRQRFVELEGFAEELVSAEDQDFALRHCEKGGIIVFLPEAAGIHRDEAADVRGYCRRMEWGSERLLAFCRRHPAWPDNVARERVNGPVRLGCEPVGLTLRKLMKTMMALPPVVKLLFATATLLERTAPSSPLLEKLYRLLLGVHILRGYRRGLARFTGQAGVELSAMAPHRR